MENFFEKDATIRLEGGITLLILDIYIDNNITLYKVKKYPMEAIEILTENQLLLLLTHLNNMETC
jgi:hypothetical protein